jgi:DNA-binding protein HU-beta
MTSALDRREGRWCTLRPLSATRFQRVAPQRRTQGHTVNKADLVDLIADKADISKASAARALDAALAGISDALRAGDQVSLVGFGTFAVKQRAERQGRNPKTGEILNIPASRTPGFKPGKSLRDAIN